MTASPPVLPDRAPVPVREDDRVTGLILRWLIGLESRNTRHAYARDMDPGLIPLLERLENAAPREGRPVKYPRIPRVPPWLAWCAMTGADPVTGITRDHVNLYAQAMQSAGLSPSTRSRKLASISGWYQWLCENGLADKNPAAGVRRPKVDADMSTTPGLTREQAMALQAAADRARGKQRLRTSALIALMLVTGARTSEVIGADIEDLGTDRGHRVLWVTRKGGTRQPLALPPAVTERLDAYLASRSDMESLPALPDETGVAKPRRVLFATKDGARLWEQNLWHQIRNLGKAAGLPSDLFGRIGPHAMRHTAITLVLDAGAPLRDVQDLAGHKDPRTTRRYDRSRYSLDRSASYLLASYLAPPEEETD